MMLQRELNDSCRVYKYLGRVPSINANAKEINQVLLCLIKNSIYAIKCKYKNDKSGIISIKTYSNGKDVFIEVKDNGIGIEEKCISKIYDPFFTTKPIGEGTGLGLSISYDIVVNKHSGEILVESKLGEGTKFTIKLPIKQNL